MITPRKTRIPYLDFLKFFAIASVLLWHSVEQTTGNDFWDNPIWSFIYTYHMPLFMLLCGYFFGSSLNTEAGGNASSTAVRALIKQLVAAEDPKKPLSDSALSSMLEEQGIQVARRTVAKYREALKIAPANLRKAL